MTDSDDRRLRRAAITQESTVGKDAVAQDLAARIRARRALEAQAIAEGSSCLAPDRPLTKAGRDALGIDRTFFDGEDEGDQIQP